MPDSKKPNQATALSTDRLEGVLRTQLQIHRAAFFVTPFVTGTQTEREVVLYGIQTDVGADLHVVGKGEVIGAFSTGKAHLAVDFRIPMKWICLSTRTKTVKSPKASVFSNFLKITLSTSPAKVTRWKRFRLKKFTFMSTITRKYEFRLARNFSFLTQAISGSIFQAVSAS